MTTRMTFFLIAISTLALAQQAAMTFFLYWKYLWLDMPMHFLGGVCVALGFSILPFLRINLPPRMRTLPAYLAFVLFVGILWETFEFANGISLVSEKEHLLSDTLIDLILDLCGGYLGYLIIKHTPDHYGND